MQDIHSPIALAIVDMQEDFVLPGGPAHVAGALATLPALRRLLDMARTTHWHIYHVVREHHRDGSDAERTRRHLFRDGRGLCCKGTPGARIVRELRPNHGEHMIIKRRYSAFFDTGFHAQLTHLGVTTLIVSGTQYPNCIRATAVDGMALDYRVIVVTDCCSAQTDDVAACNIRDMQAMGIECVTLAELPALLHA